MLHGYSTKKGLLLSLQGGGVGWPGSPPPGRSRINHICISRKRHWLRHRPSTIGRPSQPRE